MRISPIAVIIAGIAIIAGGIVIGTATPWTFPVQASSEAQHVDDLFRVLLTLGGMVFLLVQGMLVYSIIRFRADKDDTSDGVNMHGNTVLEIVWTAIPAVIVLLLAFYSWRVWDVTRAEKVNETVIQVTAQRFNWSFTYTDPLNRLEDAAAQTFNASVLHTYVGENVLLKMNALDVLHAFWVPTMRIKQDVIPGRETEIRFTPTRAGRYRVVCAELCGGGHGGMFTYIVVHETEADYFSQFLDLQVGNILNPPADPVIRGYNILVSNIYPCSGCHTLSSVEGWTGKQGPVLDGIGTRAGTTRATAAGDASGAEYLAESLRHPNDYIAPGFTANVMPQFGASETEPAEVEGAYYRYVPDEDLISIVAYLCSQTDTGNPEDTTCGDLTTIEEAVAAQSE